MGEHGRDDDGLRLMMEVRSDRPGAFEELVSRYGGMLVGFFHRRMDQGIAEAEDLAQEVFLRIFRARHRYKPTARVKSWILTIATNVCLNRRRYESRRPHVSLDRETDGSNGSGIGVEDERASNPAESVGLDELRARVRKAVADLPERQRIAVQLLRFGGLSYEEISRSLGIGLEATKSLLNRAKDTLRRALSREIAARQREDDRRMEAPSHRIGR
jgi:RNA polymerase sigma-70 factor (ECF subfamily)